MSYSADSSDYDPNVLFPADKFICIRNVPVFDEHTSNTHGKPKEVTAEDLHKYANYCNKKFADKGVASALILGHTKDGPDVKESEQPPIIGWAVRYQVHHSKKLKKKLLHADWYVKRRHESVIEEFPHRSIELWPTRNDISHIALLRTAPERDLPIIKYNATSTPANPSYHYHFTPTDPAVMNDDDKNLNDAVVGETSTNKGLAAKVDDLSAKVDQMVAMFSQMMDSLSGQDGQDGQDGDEDDQGGGDLLAPDDDGDDKGKDKPTDGKDKKPAKKDAKDGEDDEDAPAKFEAGYAGQGNTYTPSTEQKTKMSRDNEEAVKFERKIAEAVNKATAVIRKENADLRAQYNRTRAEKAVADLETAHNVDFGSPEDREEETALFADLLTCEAKGEAFEAHFNKVAKKYKRKAEAAPDSEGAGNALRYSRTDTVAPSFKSADDVQAYIADWTENPNLSRDQWLAQKSGKK